MVFACVSLLGGCTGRSSQPGGSPSAANQGDGALLRVAQEAEPTTLDPAAVQDGPTIELLMHLYEGLVQWTPENKLAPALAEKWEVGNGGKTYTFHIRQGVKFHNGRPLTSQDMVYSLTRSLDPKLRSPVAMNYLNDLVGAREFHEGKAPSVKGIEAPDAATLRLTIDAPKAYFLSKLTYPTAYAVCKEALDASGGEITDANSIGTGPFKLVQYAKGDRLILEANAEYWEGAPKLARIERRILLDDGTRHDKFEAGELDIARINMAQYRADRQNPKLQPLLHEFERPSVYYLALNQRFPPFKDKRVRQAFAHAVNKAEILNTVLEGVPRPAEGILPYGVPGFDPQFKGLAYDPERARKLLAEAGYPNGQGFPALTLSFRASMEDLSNVTTAVQSDLQKNLGIPVQLEAVEWATFLDRRNKGDMPFYHLRWAADYLDPQNFLSVMLRSGAPENTIGYANPQFDRLCDQADVMQDPQARLATYRKAEAIVVDDAAWVPIYFQKDVELWNPRLRGVEDSLMGHLPHERAHFADASAP